jgi:hypothetical protein
VSAGLATNVVRSPRKAAPRRVALGALVGGAAATLVARPAREAAGKKRRNTCHGKNWCIDRTQTCGPATGHKKCLVKAYGGNVCAEILFQAESCDDCDPPNCSDCLCALAAGGGDRCNNGVTGYDFICVRK